MSGNRRSYGYGRSLHVSGLAYHDHVRVLSEKRPKPGFKSKACLIIHLHLVHLWKILLNRILNRGYIDRTPAYFLQNHI